MEKTYFTEGDQPESQMGAALESLAHTIHARSTAGPESYTYRLLTGNLDDLLKKLDHLRYEAGDVVYHLLVLLERCGVDLDEFAAEMNTRMTEDEIALRSGVIMLKPDFVNRGSNH